MARNSTLCLPDGRATLVGFFVGIAEEHFV